MCPVCMCTSVLCFCTSVCVCVSVGCTYLCVSVCLNHCVSCRGGGGPGGCRHPDRVNRCCLGFWFQARRKGLHLGEGCPPPPTPPHPARPPPEGAVCIRLGFQSRIGRGQGRAGAPSEVTVVVLRLLLLFLLGLGGVG